MRSTQEMMDLILNIAKEDARILAVYMNGSRANPKAPKDIFQDYDIVYVVTGMKSFMENPHWIDRFGEILLKEEPDLLDTILGGTFDFNQRYAWLLQFTDGNRIDLTLQTPEVMQAEYGKDSMTLPMWDRACHLPTIPPASDQDYWIRPPTAEIFFARCNDFYWVLPYVAKGLWRDELLYALDCFQYLRPKLITMLNWKVGLVHGWEISTGKAGKYLPRYLSAEMLQRVYATYPTGNTEGIWQALFAMEALVHEIALEVTAAYGYHFDTTQRENSVNFVEHIRNLPKDATEIM